MSRIRSIRSALVLALALATRSSSAQAPAAAPVAEHPGTAAFLTQVSAQPPISDAEFVRRHVAPEGFAWVPETSLVRQVAVLRDQTGGLRVLSSERRGPSTWYRVEPQRGRGAAWIEIFTNGDRIMPWNVRLDHYAITGPPPALPEGAVPPDSVLPIVQRWLDWWERNDRWSGTIGIAKRDAQVLMRPIGLADRARRVPNTADTRYHLGSSNKMLTAVGILQLAAEGRLALDDPIGKYLPDFPEPDIAARVTIRHLLSHTSGLGGLFELPTFERKRVYGSNLAYLPVFRGRTLLFEPGTRYSYSNEGMVLAGAIIERVSGQSYDGYLQARVLGPAGMRGWCDCIEPSAHRAVGYSFREDEDPLGLGAPTDNEYFIFPGGNGAGGYYATAADYLGFAAAMRRGLLLDSAQQALMFTKSPQSPSPRGYGLGMELVSYGGKASWGHGGGGGRSGVGTQFATFADGSWTVAVMGNRDLYLATEVLRPLMIFLARQP